MPKPIVRYIPHELDYVVLGQSALLRNPPIGHTSELVSGTKSVYTSVVTQITPYGFETLNTDYRRQPDGT
jgi:hypothetical protein